jgi:RNase adaptor protein for sRNA GlmZ degradation
MYGDILGFLDRWIPEYIDFHRNYLTVAIGCTGGQHRSVYMAEKLAGALFFVRLSRAALSETPRFGSHGLPPI